MQLDALISLISNYANSYILNDIRESEDEDIQEEKSIFSEEKGEKILSNLFSVCDKDNNGELSDEELLNLIQKLESYSEFSGVSFEDFDGFSDDFEFDKEDIFEDLNTQDENMSKYQESNNKFEFLLMSDNSVDSQLLSDRSQLLEDLQENYELINALNEKSDLTDEEKEQLEKYLKEREELLQKRDEIEEKILESASDETKEALKDMQEKRIALDDKQLETNKSIDALREKNGIDTDDKSDKVSETQASSGAGGAGGTGYTGNVGSQNNVPETNDDSEENAELAELKQKLTEKQTELSTKQGELNAVIDGSSPELADLKTAEDAAFEKYNELLETIDSELSEQLVETKTAIEEKESAIAEKEISIMDSEQQIADIEMNITSIDSNLASCQKALTYYKNLPDSETDEDEKAAISDLIADYESSMEELNSQKSDLETQLQEEQENLSTLQGELLGLQEELDTFNEKMTDIEDKIAEIENTELQEAKSAYEDAKEAYITEQDTLRGTLETEISEIQGEIKEIQGEIDNLVNAVLANDVESSDEENDKEENSYTLGEDTYDTIMGADELDGLASEAEQEGEETDQDDPLTKAFAFNDKLTGTQTESEDEEDEETEADESTDASEYQEFEYSDESELLGRVQEQLSAGIPSLMHIVGNNDDEFYVSVVGVRQGAESISTSDLLVVDVKDGSIKNLDDILTEQTQEDTQNEERTIGLYVRQ